MLFKRFLYLRGDDKKAKRRSSLFTQRSLGPNRSDVVFFRQTQNGLSDRKEYLRQSAIRLTGSVCHVDCFPHETNRNANINSLQRGLIVPCVSTYSSVATELKSGPLKKPPWNANKRFLACWFRIKRNGGKKENLPNLDIYWIDFPYRECLARFANFSSANA